MMKMTRIAVAAAALFSSWAAAAPAVDWDSTSGSAAGPELQAGFQALGRGLAAAKAQRLAYDAPQQPEDAFAGIISGSLYEKTPITPAKPARIPYWIDSQSLRLEPRLTRLGPAGDLIVVLVDREGDQVEFVSCSGSGLNLVTFTKSTDEEIGPLAVERLSLAGLVRSVSIPDQLDAPVRQAVQKLFAGLR